jgi:uncharacterized protein (DUF342 family)
VAHGICRYLNVSRICVTVAANGLSAEARITAGPKATAADLAAAMTAAGIVHGIDRAAVNDLGQRLDDPSFAGKGRVALGTPPQPGTAGHLEITINTSVRVGTATADGRIDYRERGLLPTAAAGATIGMIVPPTPGAPGRDVCGRELAPPTGRQFAPRLGKGVSLEADGGIVAVRDGVVMANSKLIDVVDLWRHEGDVDLRSGNLHTSGSLLVTGDVRECGTVTAEGDVVVSGAVLDGIVRATGGVTIGQGVMGEKCFITSGADVDFHHATSAIITADGKLVVGAEMSHCWARADSAEVLLGRGHVFGGELRARTSLRLLVAGTENGAPTLLGIGELEPPEKMVVRRDATRSELQRPGTARNGPGAPKAGKTLYEQLARGSITVRGACWPGVRIQFGNMSFDVRERLEHVRFRWDADSGNIVHEDLL